MDGERLVPTIVTAAGPQPDARFAGTMEQLDTSFVQRCNIPKNSNSFTDLNSALPKGGFKLVWEDSYGTPDASFLCAIWHTNKMPDKQELFPNPDQTRLASM
jgi:hypothetical protein